MEGRRDVRPTCRAINPIVSIPFSILSFDPVPAHGGGVDTTQPGSPASDQAKGQPESGATEAPLFSYRCEHCGGRLDQLGPGAFAEPCDCEDAPG